MSIPRNLIDEINEKTDIVALVSPYVNLVKKGKNYMGQCPFHDDKSPSFSVSPEKHIAKCMACGEGGKPIVFYQKIKNISFEEAAKALAEPLGIKLDVKSTIDDDKVEHAVLKEANLFYEYYLHNSESGKLAIDYLKNRGLTLEDIKHFQIGLAPKEKNALFNILKTKNYHPEHMESAGVVKSRDDGSYYDLMTFRITFPIQDAVGRIVGFSGRALGDDPIKYLNTPETSVFHKGDTLYHLYQALRDIRISKKIVLHEGFFDVMASYRAGIPYGVATMGTALTKKQAQLIKRHTDQVIIAYDGDKAGQNATMKAIPILQEVGLRIDILKLSQGMDPDDFLKKNGKEAYQALFNETIDPYQFGYDYHKNGLDLTNANDINQFKRNVVLMLRGKDHSLREIYLKKLALDLGVSYDAVSNKETYVERPMPKNETKPSFKRDLPLKYYQAEKQLLIAMMKDPKAATRIDQVLGTQLVADMDLFRLRTVLMHGYYKTYSDFSFETFMEMLSLDQQRILKEKVTSQIEWGGQFVFDEEAITRLLDVMSSITDSKAYKALLIEIKAEKEAYTQTNMVEQQKTLKNKINKRQVNS
ncbi:MAG: DNA primase [Acholeplasma sp.]|nr:DNA primase [Acholeplasma sp.]